MNARGLWVWLWVLAAGGGPMTPQSTCAATCKGCCTSSGECVVGTTDEQCGKAGAQCQACISTCYSISYCYEQTCLTVQDVERCRDAGP